jgi:hypothetical protein
MGLFTRMKDPVEGQFNLVACSVGSGNAVYETCAMDGVVSGPGIVPTSVHHRCQAPRAKWPEPGQILPVTVDRQSPERLKIRWDQLPKNSEVARQLADQQAQQMAAAQQQWSGAAVGGVVGDPSRPQPGAPGGGLTPEESTRALAGGATALGLQAATATVIAAHEVVVPAGLPSSPGGLWDLTLDVAPPDGPGYTTVTRIAFSSAQKRAEIASLGRALPVLADPARRDRIVIDTARLT